MKKLKLVKIIAGTLVLASILALNPVGASAAWKNDSTGWWYEDESSYATGWKQLNGNWYYFNSDGYMAHDTVIDGYKLGTDGAWIQKIVLATVGDVEITNDVLDKEMSKYITQFKQQYGDSYETKAKDQITKLKKQILYNLITENILLKKATELNLTPSEDVITNKINDAINKNKAKYPEQGQFESVLKQNGLTIDEYKDYLRKQIILSTVQDTILKDVTISDDDVQTYYNNNKDTKFAVGAGAIVAHILVANEETAKSLKAKIDAGADFGTLAKENSIDPGSKDNGGSYGFIPYNSTQFIAEFMDGFRTLKEGEVSDPIKSQFGYHLIKATGLKQGEITPFDQVKDEIKASLLKEKQASTFNSKLDQWKTDLNVKTYADKL